MTARLAGRTTRRPARRCPLTSPLWLLSQLHRPRCVVSPPSSPLASARALSSTPRRTQAAAQPPAPPHPWKASLTPVAPAPVVFVSPPPPSGRRDTLPPTAPPTTGFLSPLPPQQQQQRVTPGMSYLGRGPSPAADNADDIFGPLKAVLSHAKKRPAVDDLLASYTPLGAMTASLATPGSGGGGGGVKRQRVEVGVSAAGGYSGYGGGAWHAETPGVHVQQQQQQQHSGGMAWPSSNPSGEMHATLFRSPQPVTAPGAYGMYTQRGAPTPTMAHRQMQAPGVLLPMTPTDASSQQQHMQAMQMPQQQPFGYAALVPTPAAPQPAVTQTARRIADTLQGLLGPQGGGLGTQGLADIAGPSALTRPSPMAPPPPPPFESLMTAMPPPATLSQSMAAFDVPLCAPVAAPAPPPPPATAPVTSGGLSGWDPEFMKRNLAHQVKAAEAAAQEASGQRITVTPTPKPTPQQPAPAPTPPPAAPAPAAPAPVASGWDASFLAKAAAGAKKAAEAAELEAKGIHITIDKKPAAAAAAAPAPAFAPVPGFGGIVPGGGFQFGAGIAPAPVAPPAAKAAAPAPAPVSAPAAAADDGENGGKDWGIEQLRGLYSFTHDSAASFLLPPPVDGATHTFRKAGKSNAWCGVPMQKLYTFIQSAD